MIPDAILKKIEARFGKPIRYSKDCEALAYSINKISADRISATTLKRLLGFAKSIEQPRLFTLDLIATYVGYNDWSSLLAIIESAENVTIPVSLLHYKSTDNSESVHLLNHEISISLTTQSININRVISLCNSHGTYAAIYPFVIEMIGIAAQQKNILFLKQVFDLPNIFIRRISNTLQLYYVGQSIGIMMRRNPDLAEELIETFAANKKAQQFFIEWFVDEDYLLGYYGKLLDNYHLNRKRKIQDRLFYFALKYSQALQEGNIIKSKNWYKKIKNLKLPAQVHEIPAARYFGIMLAEDKKTENLAASNLHKNLQQYLKEKDYVKAIGFTLFLSKELFRSKKTDFLITVINDFEKHHETTLKTLSSHLDIITENELNIYLAYTYHIQGNKKKANECFKNIEPNLFDPFMYQQMHKDYISVSEMLPVK